MKKIELNNLDGYMNYSLGDDPFEVLEKQVFALGNKLNEIIEVLNTTEKGVVE